MTPILYAEALTGKGMAEFVQGLDDRRREVQPGQVFRREHGRCPALAPHRIDAAQQEVQAREHDDGPDDAPAPGEAPSEDAHPAVEECVGVQQGQLDEQQIHQVALHLACPPLLESPEHALGVGRKFGLDQVGPVQLAQQLNRLPLCGSVVAQFLVAGLPDLRHRPLPVQHADKVVRGRVESVILVVGRVLDDVPDVIAVMLAVDVHGIPQPRA
jgi:hypothetical protein